MARDIDLSIVTEAFSPDEVDVAALSGHERIGALFHFEVELVAHSGVRFEPAELVGAAAAVVLTEEGVVVRRLDGAVAHAAERLDHDTGNPRYLLTLAPRAQLLTLVKTQEVFLDLSIVDIIVQKLRLCGLEHELRLEGEYPKREIVVQYAETDLSFLSRLCEHAGISFVGACEEGADRLVFTDDGRFWQLDDERRRVPLRPTGDEIDVYRLERQAAMIPRLYAVSDYNYRTPLVDVWASTESQVGTGGGVVEFGGHAKSPEQAADLAVIRRQERECRRVTLHGRADRADLGAGVLFELVDQPGHDDEELLVIEARHELRLPGAAGSGEGDRRYRNDFVAVPAAVPYRPERRTPRPRVAGIVSGTVLPRPGSDGTQPWIDEEGRYNVRLLFDTAGHEGKASHQVRMAQAHAGPGYGSHFPLRPGVEVLMAFVDGDVDRPIIIGAAPNPVTRSPVVDREPLHHRIQTASGVKIELEDGY